MVQTGRDIFLIWESMLQSKMAFVKNFMRYLIEQEDKNGRKKKYFFIHSNDNMIKEHPTEVERSRKIMEKNNKYSKTQGLKISMDPNFLFIVSIFSYTHSIGKQNTDGLCRRITITSPNLFTIYEFCMHVRSVSL